MYRSTLLLLAGTAILSAQQPTAPPAEDPNPADNVDEAIPAPPAPGIPAPGVVMPEGRKIINAAGVKGAPNPDQILLEDQIFPKMTGDELADLYFKFTGRRVTPSVAASTAEFRFIQRAPMTYGVAAHLLKKAALLEGFVFVPDPNMDGHDVLVVSTAGPNPKGEAIEIVVDPMDLPNDDRVVSYVMNLKHIKPDEVVRTFTTIVGQLGAYGSITPVPNAGAVIITEKTSLIRRLIELQETIDISGQVATRFIKVNYADVAELAETLNSVLTQQTSQRSAGLQRVPGGNAPAIAGTATGAGGGAAEDVPIQIVPDTRTNRIFAMGRPVDIIFIEGLVAEFDTRSDERNYMRRKLQFVAVADFLNIAEPALERAFSGSATGGATGGRSTGANFGGNRNTSTSNNRNTTTSNNRNSGTGSTNSGFGGSSGGFGGGGATGGTSLGDPNINSAPEARLVGRTLLVADNITNSLVVQGPPSSVEIVTNLLDQIDVKSEQVMISALFGQLALGDDFEFGLDYVRTVTEGDTRGENRVPGQLRTDDSLANKLDPFTLLTPDVFPNTSGLNLYGALGQHWNVYLKALQSDTRFQVLSRPTIYTSNNQKGVIAAGEEIAVPTNSYQGGVNTGISTNIEYRSVLLSLEVIPLVNSDDEVTLQISLVNDEVIGEQLIDGVGLVPTIGHRELLTTVTIPNGSTIVLGGLITSKKRETVTGVPLLSDIPFLGALFSNTQIEDDRQELMIFISPRIVKNSATLYDAQVDMDSRYQVAGDSRAFEQGPAVLPDPGVIEDKGYYEEEPPPVAVPVRSTRRRPMGRPGSGFVR